MKDRAMHPRPSHATRTRWNLVATVSIALIGVLAPATRSVAQPDFGFAAGEVEPGNEVTVSAFVGPDAAEARVGPGGRAVIAVVLDHAPGWHSNLAEPIVPEEMGDFAPIPTTVQIAAPGTLAFGPTQWPEPKAVPVDFFFTGNPVDFLTYAGRAVAYVPVRVSEDAPVGESIGVEVTVGYQACDDQICLAPETVVRRVTLAVVADAGDAVTAAGDFAKFDAATFDAGWSGSATAPGATGSSADTDGPAGNTTPAASRAGDAPSASLLGVFSLPTGGGPAGLLALAGLAAVGGLVLNLTPCVLPVIPIKILTLAQHAGDSRGRTLALGGSMAAGVVAFWFALGVPAALFASFADPSRVFGYWFVTAPLGILMVLLALGLMGLFAINLPKAAYMVNPKADNVPGSFLFGVMTGVLGLPCFGFVAGALIPAATTLGTTAIIVIFTALGVGMAAPYVVLSGFPKLVEKLPGPARRANSSNRCSGCC
jgi:thiol:disulfide interchange protein